MERRPFINNTNWILKQHSVGTPAQSWDLQPVNAEAQGRTAIYFCSRHASSLATELMASGTKQWLLKVNISALLKLSFSQILEGGSPREELPAKSVLWRNTQMSQSLLKDLLKTKFQEAT